MRSEEQIERRREFWTGSGAGLVFYAVNASAAYWLLSALHCGKQQFLAVPLLACGLLLFEGFALRKVSDRAATAFVFSGIWTTPIAWFIVDSWLKS
jgi:uncharacterized membrane protein YraQ (UPF0718 family)